VFTGDWTGSRRERGQGIRKQSKLRYFRRYSIGCKNTQPFGHEWNGRHTPSYFFGENIGFFAQSFSLFPSKILKPYYVFHRRKKCRR